MLAHSVSPPIAGTIRACRIEPSGGSGRKVMSVCHSSISDGFSAVCSSTDTVSMPSAAG